MRMVELCSSKSPLYPARPNNLRVCEIRYQAVLKIHPFVELYSFIIFSRGVVEKECREWKRSGTGKDDRDEQEAVEGLGGSVANDWLLRRR